jgi:muramoyltetrapeptide carboxypeptidase
MIVPKFLSKGDTIGLVATARKISIEEIKPTIELIGSKGFEVYLPNGLFENEHQFAGNDSHRAKCLEELISHNDVKAIWVVRGGYGTARMIDLVDFSKFRENPKWCIGFSDVTVLHAKIQSLHCCSIHATMPMLIGKDEFSTSALFDLVQGKHTLKTNFKCHTTQQEEYFKGKLIGGNLSVLHHLIGTIEEPNWQNSILFIEDIDEYVYHIDRMFNHFFRIGILHKIAGLLVGDFTDIKDNIIPFGQSAFESIFYWCKKANCKVVFGFPAGHDRINLPLIFGKEVEITQSENEGSLQYLTA